MYKSEVSIDFDDMYIVSPRAITNKISLKIVKKSLKYYSRIYSLKSNWAVGGTETEKTLDNRKQKFKWQT